MSKLQRAIAAGDTITALNIIFGKKIIFEQLFSFMYGKSIVDLKDWHGRSPLHTLIENYDKNHNSAEILCALIKVGADKKATNDDGFTALHLAVCKGLIEASSILVNSGASVNVYNSKQRMTPLASAAAKDSTIIIRSLLANNANVHGRNIYEEITPLQSAAQSGKYQNVKLLLQYGANVDKVSVFNVSDYRSALWYAFDYAYKTAKPHDFSIAKLLLNSGADPNLNCSPYVSSKGANFLVLNLTMRNQADILISEIYNEQGSAAKKDLKISKNNGLLWVFDDDGNEVKYDSRSTYTPRPFTSW